MNIEWGQIVTHILGFLIVLWLLRKYAWGQILGFVDKRRQTIVDSFAEIEKGQAEVEQQKHHYDAEIQKIEETRREKIASAAKEAEDLATSIKEDARRDAVDTRDRAKQDVVIELERANEILKDRMIAAVITTTEKILGEELDSDKHNRLIAEFIAKVKVN